MFHEEENQGDVQDFDEDISIAERGEVLESVKDESQIEDVSDNQKAEDEIDLQVVHRIAGGIEHPAEEHGRIDHGDQGGQKAFRNHQFPDDRAVFLFVVTALGDGDRSVIGKAKAGHETEVGDDGVAKGIRALACWQKDTCDIGGGDEWRDKDKDLVDDVEDEIGLEGLGLALLGHESVFRPD